MYTIAKSLGYRWVAYFNTSQGKRDEWVMLPHFFKTEEDATIFLEEFCGISRARLGVIIRNSDDEYTWAFVGWWQLNGLQPISLTEMEQLRPCKT